MRLLWTEAIAPGLQGLALAREGGRLLARDGRHGLFVLDDRGRRLEHRPAPAGLVAACIAADGNTFAAVGNDGKVWLFEKDLTTRWERTFGPGSAVALDSFGDRVAVADAAGGLVLLDRDGRPLWRATCPRPLRLLSFVAEAAVVVGNADFGLLTCFDARGNLLWRDAPVTHAGSLSASGDGSVIALACYSDGLCCYGVNQPRPRVVNTAPCRLADVSYDGKTFLTVGLDDRVYLRDPEGIAKAEWTLASRAVAVALAPRGDRAAVALADGTVMMLQTDGD
jgi:outer membrane protein assembly factor BamB